MGAEVSWLTTQHSTNSCCPWSQQTFPGLTNRTLQYFCRCEGKDSVARSVTCPIIVRRTALNPSRTVPVVRMKELAYTAKEEHRRRNIPGKGHVLPGTMAVADLIMCVPIVSGSIVVRFASLAKGKAGAGVRSSLSQQVPIENSRVSSYDALMVCATH